MHRLSIVGAMWLFAAAVGAQAPEGPRDQVLLLDDGALRPDLCGALRIQLTGVASVRCSGESSERALDVRIEEAAAQVRAQRARLGVLLERDPDPGLLRMLLIGEREDHALIAIERIEDRPALDVDRSLALKVRDTLESLRSVDTPSGEPAGLATALTVRPRRVDAPQGSSLRALLEAGGALSLAARARAAGLLALGVRLERDATYGELMVGAELSSSLRARGEAGRVVEDEWGVTTSARVGRQWPRFALGFVAALSVLRVSAEGSALSGERGSDAFAMLRLGMGVEARMTVIEGPNRLSLRLAPMLLLDPAAQRFALDQQTTLSLGRARMWLPLTLLLELGGRDAV